MNRQSSGPLQGASGQWPDPSPGTVSPLDCLCPGSACSAWPRAGARGGARACRPKCLRIFSITGASRIAAMIFSSPPQFGQCSRSRSNTRLSNLAQLGRTGRWCAQFPSHSAGFAEIRTANVRSGCKEPFTAPIGAVDCKGRPVLGRTSREVNCGAPGPDHPRRRRRTAQVNRWSTASVSSQPMQASVIDTPARRGSPARRSC